MAGNDQMDQDAIAAQWEASMAAEDPAEAEKAQHVTDAVRPAIRALAEELSRCDWDKASIAAAISPCTTCL